nr:MAG TPA: hypothetical protein [Caudoviricetes sp.]
MKSKAPKIIHPTPNKAPNFRVLFYYNQLKMEIKMRLTIWKNCHIILI